MGVLEDPVEMAGRTQVRPPPEDEESDSDKTKLRFQHHLADALERRRAHLLDTDFKRLPSIVLPGYAAGRGIAADPRLSAWMACDKVSRSVVHTHPTPPRTGRRRVLSSPRSCPTTWEQTARSRPGLAWARCCVSRGTRG